MLGHEKAVEEIMKLNESGVAVAMINLMEVGKINFSYLATLYVEQLQKQRQTLQAANAHLALHLGLYCGKDNSATGKSSRRLLYETCAYTGADGSLFGAELEKEFGNKNTNK